MQSLNELYKVSKKLPLVVVLFFQDTSNNFMKKQSSSLKQSKRKLTDKSMKKFADRNKIKLNSYEMQTIF